MAYRSANPFALLDDEEAAPIVAVKKVVPVVAAAAVKKVIPGQATRAPARKVFQADAEINADTPAANGEVRDDRAAGRGGRGGRGGARGTGRGASNPRSNGGTYLGGDRPRRENGGGRPFDKHSQTAHKDSDKTEAQGWGGEDGQRELAAEEAGAVDALGDATPAGAATPLEAAPAFVAEVEEEDNTQTYDEYLAAQAEKKLTMALPSARVANEGADQSQWTSSVALTKKGEAEDEWFMGSKDAKAVKAKKDQDKKTYIPIEANFKPPRREGPPREGGARGGRGGDRGGSRGRGEGRGRGGARGGATRGAPRSQNNVNVNDSTAFPSLA